MKNDTKEDDIQQVLQDTADELRNLVRAQAGLFEARASEAVDQGTDLIRKNPLVAVGAAFALGYIIAKVTRRSS